MISNNIQDISFSDQFRTIFDLSQQLEENLAKKETVDTLWLNETDGKYHFVRCTEHPKQLQIAAPLGEMIRQANLELRKIRADIRIITEQSYSKIIEIENILKKIKKLANFVQQLWNPSKSERLTIFATKRLVNFGLKKKLSLQTANPSEEQSIRKIEKEMHEKFDGCSWFDHLAFGLESVTDFLNSKVENVDKEGLLRIQAHRKILKDIKSHIDKRGISISDEEAVSFFEQRVKALNDPLSELVVHHADGSASFGIPGGCIGHAILYEIKKDNTQNYYFLIHNKGAGLEKGLHNQQVFQKNESTYRNTTLTFRVQESVFNKDFFMNLLRTTNETDIEATYAWLEQEKFENPSCYFPVYTNEEDDLQIMQACTSSFVKSIPLDNNEIIDLGNKLIDQNVYHSIQEYNTCGESCKTVAEKSMCDKQTRLKLKLFTIQQLVQFIESQTESDETSKESLLKLGKIRIENLTRKIT